MVEAVILAGACGFRATVQVESKARYRVVLRVESDCPHVSALAAELEELDAMKELFKGESQVSAAAVRHIPHRSCPVVVGILKAIEICTGLAVPKDVSITFTEATATQERKIGGN